MNPTIRQQITRRYFGGACDEKPDGTEFSLGEFGSAVVDIAPKTDWVVPSIPEVKDQGNSDFCVAFEGSYTIEQDTGLKLSAPFLFAATKKRYYWGNYYGFGLSIKKMLLTLQKDGICLEELYPFTNNRNQMANPANIPLKAWQDAATRKMESGFFLVDIFDNRFDNFLAGAYYWQEMIITGVDWYGGFYLDEKKRLIMDRRGAKFGHSVGLVGSKIIDGEQYARFTNSYVGLPEFYVSRAQMAQFYEGYIGLPISKDIAKIVLQYAGKIVRAQSGQPTIYLIQDGTKRPFRSENILNLYGLSLKEYIEVPDVDLAVIPDGEPIGQGDLKEPAIELIKRNNLSI